MGKSLSQEVSPPSGKVYKKRVIFSCTHLMHPWEWTECEFLEGDKWCTNTPFQYRFPNLYAGKEYKFVVVADCWHNEQYRPSIRVSHRQSTDAELQDLC